MNGREGGREQGSKEGRKMSDSMEVDSYMSDETSFFVYYVDRNDRWLTALTCQPILSDSANCTT